jgi:hypothetical protein
MSCEFHRRLRTDSSERYHIRLDAGAEAYLDLHFAERGAVHGSLLVVGNAALPDTAIEALLTAIDERLLPEVSRDSALLTFSVFVGQPLGEFGAQSSPTV